MKPMERFLIADDFSFRDVGQVAYALEWGWMGRKKPPETTNLIHSYLTLDDASVAYVEDRIMGVRYFIVNGPNADRAIADIRRTMRLVSRDELIAAAERAKGFEAESVAGRKLLVGAGETYDARIFELLKRKYFANVDKRIRADMITGFSYAGWPEFRALLEERAKADPDEDVRAFAAKALAAWDAEGGGAPAP